MRERYVGEDHSIYFGAGLVSFGRSFVCCYPTNMDHVRMLVAVCLVGCGDVGTSLSAGQTDAEQCCVESSMEGSEDAAYEDTTGIIEASGDTCASTDVPMDQTSETDSSTKDAKPTQDSTQDSVSEPCGCVEKDYKWQVVWIVPPAPDSGYVELSHVFAACPKGAEVSPLSDPAGAVYCTCEDGATPKAPFKSPEDGWGCWAEPWKGDPSGAECKFVFWCRGLFCESTKLPC